MTYEVVMPYHLHMPSYFLGTFTEYPKNREGCAILNEYCAALIFYFLILNFQIIY